MDAQVLDDGQVVCRVDAGDRGRILRSGEQLLRLLEETVVHDEVPCEADAEWPQGVVLAEVVAQVIRMVDEAGRHASPKRGRAT
jgi:hypothetical protein